LLAWASFIILQIPVIVSVFSGSQPFADRYSYVSMIGFYVMAGSWVGERVRNLARPFAGSLLLSGIGLVLVLLGVLTVRQNEYWRDSETLWKHVLVNEPRGVEYLSAYVNLGQVYVESGRYDLAKSQFQRALALDPMDADAHYNMAYAYYFEGQADTAMALFRRTIALDSMYAKAFYNIGIIHLRLNNQEAALDSLRKAAQLGFGDAQVLLRKNNIAW
jgi:tetratricopeptide (TPR) repeat protein